MLGYVTTKAALVMMAEQLALDLAPFGVRVNALCPGWIDTPFNQPCERQLGGREALERVVAGRVPLGRFGTTQEVADAILFLVSGRASYVTGHALVVDGGERLVGAGPRSWRAGAPPAGPPGFVRLATLRPVAARAPPPRACRAQAKSRGKRRGARPW